METRRHGDVTSSFRVSASTAIGTRPSSRRDRKRSPRPRVAKSARRISPLITLLTDFGAADHFVAAMKGVILSINPAARLLDITHEIPPQDIEAAAFVLLGASTSLPEKTINLAVVDPGVGSDRRPIIVLTENQIFVGPDNGIFSYVIERSDSARVFHISNSKYFRAQVSSTFHGRDIFAPVAAALSSGVPVATFGKEVIDPVKLKSLAVNPFASRALQGRIIHIDHFGNCITNLTKEDLTASMITAGAQLKIKTKVIQRFEEFFSAGADAESQLFAVWGSAGFLEIAARNQSATKLLKARRGDVITVKVKER